MRAQLLHHTCIREGRNELPLDEFAEFTRANTVAAVEVNDGA
jgi:hypothetical protein